MLMPVEWEEPFGIVMAEEFRGNVTKIEDGSITVKTFAFGKDKKSEEKTFKVSDDVKVTRTAGKDKDPVKLTLSELKTATKVTNEPVSLPIPRHTKRERPAQPPGRAPTRRGILRA